MIKTLNESSTHYLFELEKADKVLIKSKHIAGFSGFIRNRINLIGSRPSMDLTNFLLSTANELSLAGNKTLFITTHLPENEILKRLIALNLGIETAKVRDNLKTEIKNIQKEKNSNKLCIHELHVNELMVSIYHIEYLIEKHKIEYLIIDDTNLYIHEFHRICEEKSITLFLGKRLGKSVDKNADCRPMYKDFLKTKLDLSAASLVAGLYRPERYNIQLDENGESTVGMAELVCVKSPFEEMNSIYRINQNANFKIAEV